MVQILCSVSEQNIRCAYVKILSNMSDKYAIRAIAELLVHLAEESDQDLTAFKTMLDYEISKAFTETFDYM